MLQNGVYIVVFHLPKLRRIRVGRLGLFCFEPGVYFYVGSAQRGLRSRIERHARRAKVMRWHIDYLSCKADFLGAIVVPGSRKKECELAGELAELYELPVPHFGASDCRCGGHLFHAEQL